MKPASTGRLIPVTPLFAGASSHAIACATSMGSTSRFIAVLWARQIVYAAGIEQLKANDNIRQRYLAL
jgi:hypothetical protein